jgi:hypothetical protein
MWGGSIIIRWHVSYIAALARLRFPPLEIFAQCRFQAILSRILHARRYRLTAPAFIVRHGRSGLPMLAARRQHSVFRPRRSSSG